MQPIGQNLFSWLDTGISSKDPNSLYSRSFQMNWHQTDKDVKFSYWMDEKFACIQQSPLFVKTHYQRSSREIL